MAKRVGVDKWLFGTVLLLVLFGLTTVFSASPAIGITTLLLIGVFVAPASHHTHRWFHIGGLGTFQPSELATPVLILFLSYFLQPRLHKMDDYRTTIARAVAPPLLLIALILKEPDLGTAIVCVG